MEFQKINEGKINVFIPVETKVSRKLPVFYNPVMKFNRDVSVLILKQLKKEDMQIALPLSGTGVRGVRFLKELPSKMIKEIYFNDNSEKAIGLIKKNLEINNIKNKFTISNLDANEFLVKGFGFDYIEIDPFGSPNHFLSNSVMRLSRDGILAVTATDTAALSGTYKKACERKYWAIPKKNELMHEIGLRILIRKVQLIGMDFEKALIPIYSYSRDHYMRIFFRCDKGKKKCDEISKQLGMFEEAGPMWLGPLKEIKLKSDDEFIKLINNELDVLGFYDLHALAKKGEISSLPKIEKLIEEIKKTKYKASRTHFSLTAIKTDMSKEEFLKCLK